MASVQLSPAPRAAACSGLLQAPAPTHSSQLPRKRQCSRPVERSVACSCTSAEQLAVRDPAVSAELCLLLARTHAPPACWAAQLADDVLVVLAQRSSDVKSEGVDIPHWLNSIPHSHKQREFFYEEATQAVRQALQAGEQRLTVQCTIPELNPQVLPTSCAACWL